MRCDLFAWSASANLDFASSAWVFDFAKGEAEVNARDKKLQVLLVASPKYTRRSRPGEVDLGQKKLFHCCPFFTIGEGDIDFISGR